MNNLTILLVLVIASLVSSILMTKGLISIMTHLNIVDEPGMRRAHYKVTPRGGGLAFVIIFCSLLPLYEYLNIGSVNYSAGILQIFLPVAIVSLWDDVIGVRITFRLFIHILSSMLAVMWLVHPQRVLYDDLPILIDLALATIALVTFLNIYNFMDGIDGISAMQSIHMSLTILVLCFIKGDVINNVGFIIPTALIILGWSVGFIMFNWHPARIFLGDVGSISLGFLFGLCLIMLGSSNMHLFLASIIVALYYIADGGLTIMIRLINREKIWQPHLKHFFQRAVKKGMSHNDVVHKIMYCNIILMFCAIGCLYFPVLSTLLASMTVIYTLIKLA